MRCRTLCREIWPRIRRALPDAQMWLVGRNPRPEVLALNGHGVHVTGPVPSVVPYYERSHVCVVPLRAGGGSRLKILEAMALGRPVISTHIGSEGLDAVPGWHLLIADSPAAFAQLTVAMIRKRRLAEQVARQGRALVEERYGWDSIAGRLIEMLRGDAAASGPQESVVSRSRTQCSMERQANRAGGSANASAVGRSQPLVGGVYRQDLRGPNASKDASFPSTGSNDDIDRGVSTAAQDEERRLQQTSVSGVSAGTCTWVGARHCGRPEGY